MIIAGIEVKANGPPEYLEPTLKPVDYLYKSKTKDKVLQGRVDGFSFSKLRPYSDWETFRGEARDLWDVYKDCMHPLQVTRIALRYINRIEMPLPIKDFRDYVLTSPEIAPGIPQALNEFFFRVVIPEPEIRATAIVSSTIERLEEGGATLPYIFDIDVFKGLTLSPESAEIWKIFEELRDYKNRIFFFSITENAKELFR